VTAAGKLAIACACLLVAPACREKTAPPPAGSLVVAQTPAVSAAPAGPRSALDARVPPGSRVVLALPPLGPANVRVLSTGLAAAGEPVVTVDGTRALFTGKRAPGDAWQVWEAALSGGEPHALTSMPGGAATPALLADGSVVFTSPVPGPGGSWFPKIPSALWALAPGATSPKRLTWGAASAADPTVLSDGRILFVSAMPPEASPRVSLFTIYNDGSGVSPYACQHDGAGGIARPRELPDGRVAFASFPPGPGRNATDEVVLASRPWASRQAFAPEPSPRLHDPGWDDVESAPAAPRKRPMGRISTLNPAKKTGVIFCLDADHTTVEPGAHAARVRILAAGDGGPRTLGEVPVKADGSFLVEVPSDVPLGFEALDASGAVVRRVAPSIWVRPGENRGCIGCHEPHGLAPRNRRPLAVKEPPARVGLAAPAKAGKSS
jgi:hypothetical protein